jgi:Mn-dependent DtxR family transcriptional regulator
MSSDGDEVLPGSDAYALLEMIKRRGPQDRSSSLRYLRQEHAVSPPRLADEALKDLRLKGYLAMNDAGVLSLTEEGLAVLNW